MTIPTRRRAFAALTLAAAIVAGQSATAQWVASGRWGSETNWRYVTPGTWMIRWPDGDARPEVAVSAEAENHDGRLAMWCRPEVPRGGLVFENYFGDLLQRPDGAPGSVASQSAALVVDDRPFEIALEYHPQNRRWTALTVLEAEFLDAFSWGSRMDLRNSGGETVARFRLNASGAARSALRNTCGL